MNVFDLHGKTAVVTGATRGLGQAMAEALAEAGADIILIQRNKNNLETYEKITALGRRCDIITCDLNDPKQVKQVIGEAVENFGNIDILVNNAGIQRRSPAVEFPEDDWYDVLNVNLDAVFFLCQEAGKHMIQQGHGKIINIASLISFQGGINIPAYAAAKGGVAQLTKALSNEWAGKGVNVNAIAPGYMATDMNEALINDDSRNTQILDRIPAGRWGTPEDMKGAAIFLASAASDYVSGHILTIDGGWMGR